MNIPYSTLIGEVSKVYYNDEPVPMDDFKKGGKYYAAAFLSSLSNKGIEQIGKLIKSFEIFVPKVGWFRCECK